MKTVNFAILGCGQIGTRHAEKIQNIEFAHLEAVCDIIPERVKKLGEKYSCNYYFKLEDLLKNPKIDFINICTPSGLHPKHTISSLDAGKNVLCEKPMAIFTKDAIKMVEAAKKNKKSLFIVKQNRYNPPVKLVRQLMEEGKLGKPILCIVNMIWNRNDAYFQMDEWRKTLKLAGGTIYTHASHFVDLMLFFMGKPQSIYGVMGTKKLNIEIEDTGSVSTEFENGAYGILNYTVCATKKNCEGSITLIFSKGTIKVGGEYLNTIDYFQVEGVDSYKLEETPMEPNLYGFYQGSMSNHHKVFEDIVKNFNEPSYQGYLVTGEEAIEGVRFMESAVDSAKTKKMIKL